jgi:hypothetical protein
MEYLDREYAAKKYIQLDTSRWRHDSSQTSTNDLVFHRTSSNQSMATPTIKSPGRSIERPVIMSNAISFLPIKEEPSTNAAIHTNARNDAFDVDSENMHSHLKLPMEHRTST